MKQLRFRSIPRHINFLVVFFLCVSATLLALHKLEYPLLGIDDANIYFVYARNIASGHGFVYNAGGERVEGFTSLLWTGIAALVFRFFAYPELVLLVVNIVIVSLGLTCALNYVQQTSAQSPGTRTTGMLWSALFLFLVFTSPRYIVWNTLTLMENALWSTLLLLTTIFVLKDHRSAKEISAGFIPLGLLLLLTRPESILWVAVFAVVLFWRTAWTSSLADAWKALAPSIVAIGLGVTLLTVFRLFYFGYPLPNTYYAKVSPSLTYNFEQGALYLVRYFFSDWIAAISITILFLMCLFSLLRLGSKDKTLFLPILAVTGFLMPVLIGGDHFGSFRLYQNIYPITVLSLIHAGKHMLLKFGGNSSQLTASWTHRYLLPVLSLLFISGLTLSQARAWSAFVPEIKYEFDIAISERSKGAFIQELFSSLPQLPGVGVIASGGIKYAYPGEIIDLLGLNNTTMAHNKGDRKGYKGHAAFEIQTFYQLQPEIVWPIHVDREWQYDESRIKDRWENTIGLKGLFDDPHFLEGYQFARVSKAAGSADGTALVAWFRKDFLDTLIRTKDFLIEQYEYDA